MVRDAQAKAHELDELEMCEDGSRAMLGAMGIKRRSSASRSRSTSSSSTTSSTSRSRSRRKKQRRKRKQKSASVSSSKSEECRTVGVEESEELTKMKTGVLNELLELKRVKDAGKRNSEFRKLLRSWHPDKNAERVELATAVFQFIQKGKKLLSDE